MEISNDIKCPPPPLSGNIIFVQPLIICQRRTIINYLIEIIVQWARKLLKNFISQMFVIPCPINSCGKN